MSREAPRIASRGGLLPVRVGCRTVARPERCLLRPLRLRSPWVPEGPVGGASRDRMVHSCASSAFTMASWRTARGAHRATTASVVGSTGASHPLCAVQGGADVQHPGQRRRLGDGDIVLPEHPEMQAAETDENVVPRRRAASVTLHAPGFEPLAEFQISSGAGVRRASGRSGSCRRSRRPAPQLPRGGRGRRGAGARPGVHRFCSAGSPRSPARSGGRSGRSTEMQPSERPARYQVVGTNWAVHSVRDAGQRSGRYAGRHPGPQQPAGTGPPTVLRRR